MMSRHSTEEHNVAHSPKNMTSERHKRDREQDADAEIEIDVDASEPLSKKASRKAQKRTHDGKVGLEHSTVTRTKSALDDTADPEGAGRLGDDTKASVTGIWIGNLPWTLTKTELRTFLTSHDQIQDSSITRIHLPKPSKASAGFVQQGRNVCNRGFAYVDLDSQTCVDAALTLSDNFLADRRVLIKDAHDFKGRPERPQKPGRSVPVSDGNPPNTRIFVGNLGFDVTREHVTQLFDQCGPISQLHLATFEDSGKCKGYGWIEFETLDAAIAACRGWVLDEGDLAAESVNKSVTVDEGSKKMEVEKPRKRRVNQLLGRSLRLEFAEPKEVRYKKRFGKDDPDAVTNGTRPTRPLAAKGNRQRQSDKSPKERIDRQPLKKIDARNIRPGLALATASRASAAIVESRGTKTRLT